MNLPHRAALNPNNGTTVWGQHKPDFVTFLRTPSNQTESTVGSCACWEVKMNIRSSMLYFSATSNEEKHSPSHNVRWFFFLRTLWERLRAFCHHSAAYLSHSVLPLASFYFARMLSHGNGTATSWNSREEQLIFSRLHKQRYQLCSNTIMRTRNNTAVIRPPQHQRTVAPLSSQSILTWDRCGKSKSGWGLLLSTRDLA